MRKGVNRFRSNLEIVKNALNTNGYVTVCLKTTPGNIFKWVDDNFDKVEIKPNGLDYVNIKFKKGVTSL